MSFRAHRIATLACCIAVATIGAAAEPYGVERADIIVVARVLGPAEYEKRLLYYEDGTVVPDVEAALPWPGGSRGRPLPPELNIAPAAWVPLVRFEAVLVLKGDPGAAFTYTDVGPDFPTLGTSPAGEPARTPAGLERSNEDPTGRLYLLCLDKRRARGLPAGMAVGDRPTFLTPGGADEYIEYGTPAVQLREGRYVLEGKTARQRWSSIIVQAWQRDPARPLTLLNYLRFDQVPWTIKDDGTKAPADAAFARFAEEKLVPRLNSLKTDRLLNRIRANYWSWWLTINTDKYFPEFQRLVQELDRTWPDPNAPPSAMWYYFDGLYGPPAFIQSLVSARTVFLRCKAVESLPVDHANLRLVVDRLRVEASFHVQLQCCTWLSLLGHKEYPRYADAPNEAWERETINNLQSIINYWSDK